MSNKETGFNEKKKKKGRGTSLQGKRSPNKAGAAPSNRDGKGKEGLG